MIKIFYILFIFCSYLGKNPTLATQVENEAKQVFAEYNVVDDVAKGTSVFKVITTDIRGALRKSISHITEIQFTQKANGTYQFTGCHSKSALEAMGNNARIEITGEEYTRLHFSECNMATSSITTAPTMPVYICKELENPVNTKVSYHLHLWNKKDRVAGGLAGDDYYKNKITKNIEISVSKEFNNVEWIDAHSFDSYRPQLIYELIKNNTIPKIP